MGDVVDMAVKVAMMLLSAGAVYGGIRADLKAARQRAEEAVLRADKAHERIDKYMRGHGGF